MSTETTEDAAKSSAPTAPASAGDGSRKHADGEAPKEARRDDAPAAQKSDANNPNEVSKPAPKDESQSKPRTPWWQSGPWVSVITALIASMAPSAAALHSYFRAEGELKLAQQRQQHEVQSFYFKLAVEKDSAPELRERVLRYLARDSSNPSLQGWAQTELVEVAETLRLRAELEKKEAELNEKVAAFEAAKADEKTKQAQLEQAQKEKEGLAVAVRDLSSKLAAREGAAVKTRPALTCAAGTTEMLYEPAERSSQCGSPSATAYLESGYIYWTVQLTPGNAGKLGSCRCTAKAS